MSTTWRLRRLPDSSDEETEDELVDVDPCTDAYNRFARSATVVIDDPDGERIEKYPKATPIALDAKRDIDDDFVAPRLGGFVSKQSTDEQSLELEVLSFDHWLRRRKPTVSYTDELISGILEHLIKNFTPLEWDPDLVDVGNDEEITREWRGETVDEIVSQLADRSAGENYGATNDGAFYFEEAETEKAPRSFTDAGDYYEADFDDDIKEEVNRAVVHYEDEDGEKATVAVQDRASQKELQEEINAASPVVIELEKEHPEISTSENAEKRARKYLGERTSIRTGTITTWEGFDLKPGQVTAVEIPEQDVDDEYVIAEVEYTWLGDETTLELAQNSEGVTDVLVGLSDEMDRVDVKNVDPDAPVDEHFDTSSGGTFDVTGDVSTNVFGDATHTFGVNADEYGIGTAKAGISFVEKTVVALASGRLTKDFLRAIRDAWTGDEPVTVTQLLVGGGDSSTSKTDDALDDEIADTEASIGTPGDFVARFTGSVGFDDVEQINELGLESDSAFLLRAVLEDTIDAETETPLAITLEVEARNNDDQQSTLVSAGRTALRDIVADADPAIPDEVAYGTGELDLEEDSDDALDSEVVSVAIDEYDDGSAGVVTVVSTVDDDQAIGEDLAELGQVDSSGTLLTYVTFSTFPKGDGETFVTNDETVFKN